MPLLFLFFVPGIAPSCVPLSGPPPASSVRSVVGVHGEGDAIACALGRILPDGGDQFGVATDVRMLLSAFVVQTGVAGGALYDKMTIAIR